jgi:hypothetical protein
MKPVSYFEVTHSNDDRVRGRLVRDGRVLSRGEVYGAILKAQFELPDGTFLLWLTDDSPYDEGLHIYLLNHDEALEDSLEAGADFTAGILQFKQLGDYWVDFSFFNNDSLYRLNVLDRSSLLVLSPRGWKYTNRLRRHRLHISRIGSKTHHG